MGGQLWPREQLQTARHPPPGTGPWVRLLEEEGLPDRLGFPGQAEASLPGLIRQRSSEPAPVGGQTETLPLNCRTQPSGLDGPVVFGGQRWLSRLLLPLAGETKPENPQ